LRWEDVDIDARRLVVQRAAAPRSRPPRLLARSLPRLQRQATHKRRLALQACSHCRSQQVTPHRRPLPECATRGTPVRGIADARDHDSTPAMNRRPRGLVYLFRSSRLRVHLRDSMGPRGRR
jgi:hypothetical protein